MITMLGANDVAMENSQLVHGDQMVQEGAVNLAMYLDGEIASQRALAMTGSDRRSQ